MAEIYAMRMDLGMSIPEWAKFDRYLDYAIGLLDCGPMVYRELQMRLKSAGCGDAMACDVIDEIARKY